MSYINRKDLPFIYPKGNEITLFPEDGSFAEISPFWFVFCQGSWGCEGLRGYEDLFAHRKQMAFKNDLILKSR